MQLGDCGTDGRADPTLVRGDLIGLVAGKVAGRCADGERTAFVFRGDLAVAGLAYQRACEQSQGTQMEA